MITQNTADEISRAFREVAAAEKLLEQIDEQLAKEKETRGFHGEIGTTARGCQLGWPDREGYRLYFVEAKIARACIVAHLADQQARIVKLNETAKLEASQ